jgi:hypothetical protein
MKIESARLSAGGFLVVLLAAHGAAANPIRGISPGIGISQRNGLVAGATLDLKEEDGVELRTLFTFVDLRYALATHWELGVRVPYLVESRVERPGAAAETASGLGDLVVSMKHRFYRRLGPWSDRHAAVEVRLKLPTGATELPVDPGLPVVLWNRLQPGTGSTDGLILLVYQQAQGRFGFAADAGYRYNTEGDGAYRRGNEARVNLSAKYVLFPRQYEQPGHEVFAVLDGTLLDVDDDRVHGITLPGTDRTGFLLAPGLQYVATERLFLDLSLQVPVWEEVGRSELASRWNLLAQLRYAL